MKYTVEVNKDGTFWYKEGTNIRHRIDGPAIERANGDKSWWKDGQLHREDGPAVEYANGDKEWFIDGVEVDEPNHVKELTVAEIEASLGYSVKIVK